MRNVSDTRLLVLQSVLEALGDPLKLNLCVYSLLGGIATLEELLEDDAAGVLVDAFRDAAVWWLTAPRTRTEMDKLRLSLRCSCNEGDLRTPSIEQFMHRSGQHHFGKSTHTLPSQALLVGLLLPLTELQSILQNKSHGLKFHTLGARRKSAGGFGRTPPWPRSSRQLLPHGPESSIRGLTGWLREDANEGVRLHIYSALNSLMSLGATIILPHLVTSPTYVRFMLNGLQEDYQKLLRARLSNEDRNDYVKRIIIGGKILVSFAGPGQYLPLSYISQHFPSELLVWIDRLISLMDAAMVDPSAYNTTASKHHLEATREEFIRLARVTYVVNETAQPERIRNALAIKSLREELVPVCWGPWPRLLQTLHDLRHVRHCTAPGCDGSGPVRLRYCTGCLRLPYCSRECQRKAWRHTVAHRDICSTLRTICTQFNLTRKGALKAKFDHIATHPYHIDAERVVSHIRTLGKYNSRIPSELATMNF
jgi:hypothetical protein